MRLQADKAERHEYLLSRVRTLLAIYDNLATWPCTESAWVGRSFSYAPSTIMRLCADVRKQQKAVR